VAVDLSGSDLRGRSFAGASLPFSSLAGADLRGTDLTGADLRGADLSRIRAGMSRGWTAVVVLGALALSVGIGALSGLAGQILHQAIASDDLRHRAVGLLVAAALVAFLLVGIWKGLRVAARSVLPAATAIALVAGIAGVVSGLGTGAGALAVLAFLLLVAAIEAVSVLARAVAGTAGAIYFVVVALAGALTGRVLGGGLAALAIAIGAMVMARRAPGHRDAFPLMTRLSAAIACRRGTRLRDADLTGARFDGAHLVACDLRGARLAGASFAGAEIRLCRFGAGRGGQVSSPPPEVAGRPGG